MYQYIDGVLIGGADITARDRLRQKIVDHVEKINLQGVKRMDSDSSQWCQAIHRGNRQKLEHRKFYPNFFTLQMTEHWNRLPREVVE